ncbi:MAG: ABC transporter permease [Pseudomonadota bacterium]
MRDSKVGAIGVILCLFWIFVGVFAPFLAPFPADQQLAPMQNALPGTAIPDGTVVTTFTDQGMERIEMTGSYLLGGDKLGRDVLSRVVWGARSVMIYAPLATALAYGVGIIMGLLAGYKRGWIDDVLSRVSDIVLSFPVLVLYVVIIVTFGASALNIMLAITFASAPAIMRIVRGLTLDLRTRDYVAAAQTRGESALYIMLVEILPNARGPLIVDVCLRLGYVTITIGTLGFLGLGLPPPDPNWGNLIAENKDVVLSHPHSTIIPCVAISSLVLGLNLLADGLREVSLSD